MSITIHGSSLSPFTRKVTLVALEKDIPFTSKDLNPYSPPDGFEEMSPLKRIPILQHGDYTLNDSSAISAYLDSAFKNSEQALIPDDPKAQGYVLWIEEYADTALFEVISEGVFRPIFINPLMGKSADFETVKNTVANKLPLPLGYLEQQLAGKKFFSENRLTLADLAVYSQLINLEHSGQLPKSKTYPNLMAHYDKIKLRKTAQDLFESEKQYLNLMLKLLNQSK